MNKPTARIAADDDLGPLDEHGQQIWTPEEEAAIARLHADPAFQAAIAKAEADIAANRVCTDEEARAHMASVRQRFLADRGR